MFGELFNAFATPLLQGHLAEPIAHWPLGVSANAAQVQVIPATEDRTRKQDRGVGYIRKLCIDVPAALVVNQRDRWRYQGETWNTHMIHEPDGGLRRIEIIVPLQQTTTHPARDLMDR